MEDVGAVFLSMSNGNWNCEQNHLRVWRYMAEHNPEPFSVVLEDDAVPCEGFREQLEQVLAVAPTPVVGLYLGTSTPPHWQRPIRQAITEAEREGAHWLITHSVINAVGVAIRTDLLPVKPPVGKPIDEALAQWAKTNGRLVGYPLPSLLDHRDEEPVIRKRADGGKRTEPRVAWRFGTRDKWTDRSVEMMPQWANIP